MLELFIDKHEYPITQEVPNVLYGGTERNEEIDHGYPGAIAALLEMHDDCTMPHGTRRSQIDPGNRHQARVGVKAVNECSHEVGCLESNNHHPRALRILQVLAEETAHQHTE